MTKLAPNMPGVVLIDQDGNIIPITGDLSVSTAVIYALANAADPALVEATNNAFSTDLHANLRVTENSGKLYETVAAGQTAKVLGATGATGDFLGELIIIPATTSPGQVLLLDGAMSITIFVGGATSVADLKPFSIKIGAVSKTGAWKITTGTNVSVMAVGRFT